MAKQQTPQPISADRIAHSILVLRGHKVLLDRDLAAIYGVTTGRLNEAVKRNAARFPEDFMFQLSREEAEASRSQIAILNGGRGFNVKYLPFAFTEHGAMQAANVLRSARAVEMGIYVVRAFIQLRALLASNKVLAQELKKLERKVASHDVAITDILKTIRELMNTPAKKSRPIGFTANLDEER